jgi:hypothetical protein
LRKNVKDLIQGIKNMAKLGSKFSKELYPNRGMRNKKHSKETIELKFKCKDGDNTMGIGLVIL